MTINQDIYSSNLDAFRESFSHAKPYPHVVIDRFLSESKLQKVNESFPEVDDSFWTHYLHYNEKKHGLTKWEHFPIPIQETITTLQQPLFISWLESVTGITDLFPDSDLEGSGLHQTKRGGYLNIHADFSVHPKQPTWKRRVNVLLYLNKNWDSEWGGSLELWNKDMSSCDQSILPKNNRLVIFETGEKTFHGYPEPIKCPENEARKSIALYYYTLEESPIKSSTLYQPRPNDGLKKWLIYGDSVLISLYTQIKGTFGFNDDFVSSVLKYFNRKK